MSGKWIIVTRRLGARGQRFPLLVFALRYLCTHFFEITWPTMLTARRLCTNSITRASIIRKKKTPTKKSYRFFLVAIMIDNLTKSATFLITLVVDIFKEAKEIECLFFVQDDLVTWNQSTFMIELLQTLFSHYYDSVHLADMNYERLSFFSFVEYFFFSLFNLHLVNQMQRYEH